MVYRLGLTEVPRPGCLPQWEAVRMMAGCHRRTVLPRTRLCAGGVWSEICATMPSNAFMEGVPDYHIGDVPFDESFGDVTWNSDREPIALLGQALTFGAERAGMLPHPPLRSGPSRSAPTSSLHMPGWSDVSTIARSPSATTEKGRCSLAAQARAWKQR